MKRIASAALSILVVALTSTTIFGQASVPNLVNFQGRLLNNLGSPVADGSYGVTFRLFDAPVGGTLVWAETSLVSTSSGVFTHQLGSDNPFDVTLFQDYDSLFLEIVVGGETITPRTRLTSAPYTRLAGGIEVPANFADPETLSIGTNQFHAHSIKTFGSDGQEQFRVWGDGWGEIYLYDQSVTNDQTVVLSATGNSGGQFSLNQEDGTSGMFLRGGTTSVGATLTMRDLDGITTVSLDADAIGDAAALLPTSSVSAIESSNEPGVASDHLLGPIVSAAGLDTITFRSIFVPTSGYVLVIGSCEAEVSHSNGSTTNAAFGVSDSGTGLPGDQDFEWGQPSVEATGNYDNTITVHGLFSVNSGSHTFYFLINKFTASGSYIINDVQLTLAFFPTAYGTVDPTLAAAFGETDEQSRAAFSASTKLDVASEQAETDSFNALRLEKELAEIKAQRDELEARIQKLEKQFNQTGPSQGVDQ